MQATQPQELQLYDIYGLWHVPFWQQWWFKALLLLIMVALFSLCVYKLYRYIQARKPAVPFWQKAAKRLSKLKKRGFDVAASQQFYVVMTDVLKYLMSHMYGKELFSYTDQQMIEYVKNMPLSDVQQKQLVQIFSAGQMIKFAHQEAMQQQMQQDFQAADALVQYAKKLAVEAQK